MPADAKCIAKVGDSMALDEIAPGSYHVTVNCGARGLAQGDVKVTEGRVVILDTDLKSHRLNLLGDRSRVTRVAIADPNKAIVNAPLSPEVKRAIINGLSGGATISAISVPEPGVVYATVECPTSEAEWTFFERLQRSGGAIKSVMIDSAVSNDNGSLRVVVVLRVAT